MLGHFSIQVSQGARNLLPTLPLQPHIYSQDVLSQNVGSSRRATTFGVRRQVLGPECRGAKSGGFGAASTSKKPKSSPVDSAVLLRRSTEDYARMLRENWQEGGLREFVVCVRVGTGGQEATNGNGGGSGAQPLLADWLPVAELALVSELEATAAMPFVLPSVCRELAECAARTAPAIRSVARQKLEYAFEPLDSFYEHVLGGIMEGSASGGKSAECPYSVLNLPRSATSREVRSAYRELAAQHHPDRHTGEAQEEAEVKFKRIADAYAQIKSDGGVTEGSGAAAVGGFASLGGDKRAGLSEAVRVSSTKAGVPVGTLAAVRALDAGIVEHFLARAAMRPVV